MLRIALTSSYDFAYPGGVNEHVRYLAQHLRKRGHLVDIIGPCSDDNVVIEGLIKVESATIPISFGGTTAYLALSPTVWREVKEILKERAYDIVHVHEPTNPSVSPAALYYSRSINVGTFHQYRETHALYEVSRPLARYFTGRLHGRIAVSGAALEFAEHYFANNNYRIIPNGIEVAHFQQPALNPWERYSDDGKLNILFVGRLERRKGFRHLLRAFRDIKKSVPEARLLVVGAYTKEDRLSYVRYARYFRIRDVKFIGLVSDADKPRWYKTADIFCAPSIGFESFGLVLAEAMSAGVPIVASNIAGYRDLLKDGVTGLLVPPEDEEALATTIIDLLRSPARRHQLSKAALDAVQRYDWKRVSHEIEDYYWELLEERNHNL